MSEMNFASDNTAGIAPDILRALAGANDGFALGYGNDERSRDVERLFAHVFERDVAVFLVTTGTAANAIALAHVSPPWGAVLCHREAHAITDECGAPEFFGGGLRLIGLPGEACKLAPQTLQNALGDELWGGPHHVSPSALSLTQATEAGTIYRLDEIAALAALAHARGLAVHMDGARFANALVRLAVTPAEMTWKSGIDVLSLGATKGGAMAAEAIVFFDPARAASMAERRKRGGDLVSKHRFLAAQFAAFFAEDYWLTLARHANSLADRLAARLAASGCKPVWPVEANIVFVIMSKDRVTKLKNAGASFYVRRSLSLPAGIEIGADESLLRLVTSFATSENEVDRFVELACR
jgi:threonine aldolase